MKLHAESTVFNDDKLTGDVNDAAKTATDNITQIDSNGIWVTPTNKKPSNTSTGAGATGAKIDGTNGFGIWNNGVNVAQYGTSARVGSETSGHVNIASTGMQVYGSSGSTLLANIGYGEGTGPSGSSATAPYYSLGVRTGTIGNYSVVEGNNNTASGFASHAEGEYAEATGVHAHAQNNGTIARYSQTVIGEYNVAQGSNTGRSSGDLAFIIGNGVSNNARSNALTVDWEGNVKASSFYDTINLSLGSYNASGFLTNTGGTIHFSIPTGRVFPNGTTVSSISFDCVARVANANGTGYYCIKSSNNGTGPASINSLGGSAFYNAGNVAKSISNNMWTISLNGGTNITIAMGSGDDFFSGTSTIRGYTNNQPVTLMLTNISVLLSLS